MESVLVSPKFQIVIPRGFARRSAFGLGSGFRWFSTRTGSS